MPHFSASDRSQDLVQISMLFLSSFADLAVVSRWRKRGAGERLLQFKIPRRSPKETAFLEILNGAGIVIGP